MLSDARFYHAGLNAPRLVTGTRIFGVLVYHADMKTRLLLLSILLLVSRLALAGHALALGYTPKYPVNFSHFEYVNPQAPKGGELVLPNPDRRTSFDSFNPFVIKGTAVPNLAPLMFESLAVSSLDEPASAYGLLAEDMQVAADGLSATFRLNPAARFNNGDAVLAADVKHSFDMLTSKAASPAYRSALTEVAGTEIVDARTVRYRFRRANPELPLTVASLPVFSRKWGGGKPLDQIVLEPPIASGPYAIAGFDLGRSITYQRRTDYWASEHPARRGQYNFGRITYRFYKDDVARLEAFKAGEFDFLVEYSARNWARQYQGPKFRSGELQRLAFVHHNTAGMQGFVLNTRKALFADKRVREALGLALDFEWLNRQLFYNQYTRIDSFYSNGDLAASGVPSADELKLLTPLRSQLDPSVFGPAPQPPSTNPPASLRDNLRRARDLLAQAGWTYRDGALRNAKGEPFVFEWLDDGGSMSRVFAVYERNLAKLGIAVKSRQVDYALYQRRLDEFDFDLISLRFGDTQSPGIELYDYYGSKAATEKGSSNVIGLKDPAVDKLIDAVVNSQTRAERLTAVHALDRVLRHGYYIIPQWYSATHRTAWKNRLAYPQPLPLYYQPADWMLQTWWVK
ncbi:MAG: putative ABC-type transport system, periplasmic component [Proteobacteria bacterium]|nr:putative ABC-type transport system, periplasmic component [Pseudomonadota bacterium]